MLVTGKVLFDNTWELKKLVQDAKKYLTKKYPKLTKTQVEIAKYHLRDMQDNLLEVLENDAEGFPLVYYVSLYELFDSYAKFLQFDALPIHKLKHLLMDASTKKKYMIADFPDQVFVHLFLPALSLREKADMSEAYTQLSDHVLVKMCGFEIDGRKIRTPAVEKK